MLHLFWEYPPYIQGGLGVAGKALCDSLSKYTQLDIVCPETPSTKTTQKHPYPIYQIKMPSHHHLSSTYSSSQDEYEQLTKAQINAFSNGVKIAHFTKYSTIHAHDWITADAAQSIQQANKTNHIPIILHIHSTQIDRIGQQSNSAIFHKEKIAMQNAHKIITVSHLTKKTIIKHYHIAPQKIIVIPNSIPKLVTPSPRPPHPPTILFAARMEPQKSPLFALEIICAALKKVPKARAIITGQGSALNAIRNLVTFKNMNSRIEVLGHVPHEKMHLIYQTSDVLILPSASEPYGLVALEAAQSGTSVILSDRCGAAETLHSAPQLTLNTTDSFPSWVHTTISLLTDNNRRKQQIKNQQTELAKYSWDQAARKLLSTLEISI